MASSSINPTESNVLRVKTLATRMTSDEMREVKMAASSGGLSCSDWLRAAALSYLQSTGRHSTHPIELTILQEISGLRFLLVNLYAGANAGLATETIRQLMAQADAAKYEVAEAVRVSSAGRASK